MDKAGGLAGRGRAWFLMFFSRSTDRKLTGRIFDPVWLSCLNFTFLHLLFFQDPVASLSTFLLCSNCVEHAYIKPNAIFGRELGNFLHMLLSEALQNIRLKLLQHTAKPGVPYQIPPLARV